MPTSAELVDLEVLEQLEARACRTGVRQSHMPTVRQTSAASACVEWQTFEYEEQSAGGRTSRQHVYATAEVEYIREGDGWRTGRRVSSPHRTDSACGALPDGRPPAALNPDWLSGSAQPTVEALVDLEQIRQLKARYFRHLDNKDWVRWREVFTADAVFNVPPLVIDVAGADSFVAAVSSNLAGSITVHHGHAPEIRLSDSANAVGVWVLNDYVEFPAGDDRGMPSGIRGYGHYQERYRRTDDGWRIAELRLSYLRIDPLLVPSTPQSLEPQPTSEEWPTEGVMPTFDELGDLHEIKTQTHEYFRLLDASARGALHHLHTPEVRFLGRDQARAVWALMMLVDRSGSVRYGHLEAEYVRAPSGWRIAGTRTRWLRVDPLPAGGLIGSADPTSAPVTRIGG